MNEYSFIYQRSPPLSSIILPPCFFTGRHPGMRCNCSCVHPAALLPDRSHRRQTTHLMAGEVQFSDNTSGLPII